VPQSDNIEIRYFVRLRATSPHSADRLGTGMQAGLWVDGHRSSCRVLTQLSTALVDVLSGMSVCLSDHCTARLFVSIMCEHMFPKQWTRALSPRGLVHGALWHMRRRTAPVGDLKGSNTGALDPVQCFGNWICCHPPVKAGRRPLC
jgi:hypothetical protein